MAGQVRPQRFSPHTTGSSFEREERDLLDERLRIVFGVAFLISAVSNLFYEFAIDVKPTVQTPLAPYMHQLYYSFTLLFGLAVLALVVRKWSRLQLLAIDYAVITIAILLAHFLAAVFSPHLVPLFATALLLFIHAAFVPVPVGHQSGLAVTAALGYPLASFLSYAAFSGVAEFWQDPMGAGYFIAGRGFETFRDFVLEATFMLTTLAAVSVLITYALYNMRRSLHEAQRMGNYVIKKLLGEGGMGLVYVAEHALMWRPTALKVLKDAGRSSTAAARFEREVMLSATLSHPNTITVYDFGRTGDGTFYYAMEYLSGLDLQRLVERFGPLSQERAVYVLDQVCGSLAEAHSRDIVHRDIKPSNVFLTHRGGIYDFVKVLDFGLAKETKVDSSVTQTGVIFGTPLFMPPEMALGSEVDTRSDIYCLGGVAYWILSGNTPFPASSGMRAILDNINSVPRPVSQASELEIDPELEKLVMKCLEKEPEDRFGHAADLQAALRRIQLAERWTQENARGWWELHAPEEDRVAELVSHAVSGVVEMPEPVVSG